MADALKGLAEGTLGTGSGTLYTCPASTATIVKTISLSNITATDATATIILRGKSLLTGHVIPANDSLILRDIGHILEAAETITGLAGTGSAIDYIISGMEVGV